MYIALHYLEYSSDTIDIYATDIVLFTLHKMWSCTYLEAHHLHTHTKKETYSKKINSFRQKG